MRRRVKQTINLRDRLSSFAKELRGKAAQLPAGPEREDMLKRARRADTAAYLDDWADPPGLQPPKWGFEVF